MRQLYKARLFILMIFLAVSARSLSQGCPSNIGFEDGSFNSWECFIGSAGGSGWSGPSPYPDRHTIIQKTTPLTLDPYGMFPQSSPNGGNYSVKIGNSFSQSQADRVSYTFTIPAGLNEYSITYNYAVVFQDPGHAPAEQPKFVTRVLDATEGIYLTCGSFEYIASSGLPGFAQSPIDPLVFYKTWSQVTVKLNNCAGKTITLEFTVNDCSRGGHFGYAYVDVNQNCLSPITGNVFCNGSTSMTLTGPYGFQSYKWYPIDYSTVLGTSNILQLNPIPPSGTQYALVIEPYPGAGCLDTLYTTIKLSPDAFQFNLLDTLRACVGNPANLTSDAIKPGSTPGLIYSYFTDATTLDFMLTPENVTTTGTYYIKAINASGCTEIKSIAVTFGDMSIQVNDPTPVCFPNTVDLTAPSIISTSQSGITYSYWKDANTSLPLTNASSVAEPGIYYINARGVACTKILPVTVSIRTGDDLRTNLITGCGDADLTSELATVGSSSIFTFSYWKDGAGTIPIANPKKTAPAGVYYIKGTTPEGCNFIKPINITIKPLPSFTVFNPPAVLIPYTVDITRSAYPATGLAYSYWEDSLATDPVKDPLAIKKNDTLYIKGFDSSTGCASIQPVIATVTIPRIPIITYPNAFSPNNDNINDQFKVVMSGDVTIKVFRVFDRWGRLVFETKDPLHYWNGEKNGKPMPVGTYYWVLELINNIDKETHKRHGSVSLLR